MMMFIIGIKQKKRHEFFQKNQENNKHIILLIQNLNKLINLQLKFYLIWEI